MRVARALPLALLALVAMAALLVTVTAAAATPAAVESRTHDAAASALPRMPMSRSLVATPTPAAAAPARSSFQRMLMRALNTPLLSFAAGASGGGGLSFGSNLSLPEQSAFIAVKFHSSSKVAEVRSRVPRYGKDNGDNFDPTTSDYLDMLIAQVIPGGALFVITLLIWVVYGIATCCCCAGPKHTGYTRRERAVPLFIGSLFALLVVAFTIIGLRYTEAFDEQLVKSGGLTSDATNVLHHVESFFSTMDLKLAEASDKVTQVTTQGPDSIMAVISNFTDVGQVLPVFLGHFRGFGAEVASRSPLRVYQDDPLAPPQTPDPLTYNCTFCEEFLFTVEGIASAIDIGATPVLAQIESTKVAAQRDVVSAEQSIQTNIVKARSQVTDVNSKATKYDADVADYTDKVKKYEEIRRAVGLVIFLLPLLIVALWFIFVVAMRREFGAKCLICGMFPLGMLMWLVFLVHLPFAVLVADSCHYMDGVEPQLASVSTFDVQVAATLTACLAQQNLLKPLGVADDLDFSKDIVFPAVPNVNALLNTTALDEINATVQNLTLAAFSPAYDPDTKSTALDNLNALTNTNPNYKYFGFNNVSSCVYTDYSPAAVANQVRGLRNVVVTALKGEAQMTALIVEAQANMTRIYGEFNALKNATVVLLGNLGSLKDKITPLLNAAQDVIDSSFCAPLDEDYLHMKQTFCDDIIVSVSAMAMASFFVGIFLGLMNFSAWFLTHRLQHGSEAVESFGVPIVTGSASAGGAGVLLSSTGAADPYVGGNMVSNDRNLGVGSDMELATTQTPAY